METSTSHSSETTSAGLIIETTEPAKLPTEYGLLWMVCYLDYENKEHLLVKTRRDTWPLAAPVQPEQNGESLQMPLVRVHSQCLTGDVFGSIRCDCGEQLGMALQQIHTSGNGALLYMQQEGRGIGLRHKVRAYALQDRGFDTVDANLELHFEADLRRYDVAAAILKAEGLHKIRLMTNNPQKMIQLGEHGIEILEREPVIASDDRAERSRYLDAKQRRMGHWLARGNPRGPGRG